MIPSIRGREGSPMRTLKIIITVLLVASALQSCSIRSSQFASIAGALNQPAIDLDSHSWTMTYGNYKTTVYAVAYPNGTLFANKSGDKVFFDGWSVTEVSGLGANQADWKVVDKNNGRMFIRGNILIGEHFCESWDSTEGSNRVRFNQDCRSFDSYSNVIITDDEGYITHIRQNVIGKNTFLTLNKN